MAANLQDGDIVQAGDVYIEPSTLTDVTPTPGPPPSPATLLGNVWPVQQTAPAAPPATSATTWLLRIGLGITIYKLLFGRKR